MPGSVPELCAQPLLPAGSFNTRGNDAQRREGILLGVTHMVSGVEPRQPGGPATCY